MITIRLVRPLSSWSSRGTELRSEVAGCSALRTPASHVVAQLCHAVCSSSQDDNCQHTRFTLQVWKQFINLGVIVVTDPFASKQVKRVKLLQVSFVVFVCKNFQYTIPNIAGGSKFIAPEGLQRLSRAHDHIAIKRHCRHIIFVRHLTSITGSTRRMRSTGPRPRPPT